MMRANCRKKRILLIVKNAGPLRSKSAARSRMKEMLLHGPSPIPANLLAALARDARAPAIAPVQSGPPLAIHCAAPSLLLDTILDPPFFSPFPRPLLQ